MRFSVASGTDNSILQLISNSNADIELHTHEIDNHTRPYGVEGLNAIQKSYGPSTVAPHGSAQRWSYIVPANKIARLDLLSLGFFRATAPTSAGEFNVTFWTIPSGGAKVLLQVIASNSSTIGDTKVITISPKIIFEAGDELQMETIDISTGGTVSFFGSAYLSELDA